MGTNFYWTKAPCPVCGQGERYHIGKASMGWKFSFQGHDDLGIGSFAEWRAWLSEDGIIEDEYGEEYSVEEFTQLVERHCPEGKVHADKNPGGNWKDAEGYLFSFREFS